MTFSARPRVLPAVPRPCSKQPSSAAVAQSRPHCVFPKAPDRLSASGFCRGSRRPRSPCEPAAVDQPQEGLGKGVCTVFARRKGSHSLFVWHRVSSVPVASAARPGSEERSRFVFWLVSLRNAPEVQRSPSACCGHTGNSESGAEHLRRETKPDSLDLYFFTQASWSSSRGVMCLRLGPSAMFTSEAIHRTRILKLQAMK